MSSVEIDSEQLRRALRNLAESVSKPRSALLDIGEELSDRIKQRFGSGKTADGKPWAPNRPSTLARKKPETRPLIGETHTLQDTITYQTQGSDTLLVGSPMEYAAAQQFGMPKGYAGTTKHGLPIPWGDIPARPFIGLSGDDESTIIEIIADHIKSEISG